MARNSQPGDLRKRDGATVLDADSGLDGLDDSIDMHVAAYRDELVEDGISASAFCLWWRFGDYGGGQLCSRPHLSDEPEELD